MKRALILLAFVATLVPYGAPQADAAIGCGSTITRSVTLKADIGPCGAGDAITLEGHGFTFDLGGHKIIGSGLAMSNGILVDHGTSRVRVRNGAIDNFDDGLVVFGRGNRVSDIVSFDSVLGVVWEAVGGSMVRTRTWNNSTTGLLLGNPSQGSVIRAFSAIDDATGASVSRPATITDSFFTNNSSNGMTASGSGVVLLRNYFNHNGGIGLNASGSGAKIGSNIANYNGTYGMAADQSLIDLGGNLAKDNGTAAQCNNVSCN